MERYSGFSAQVASKRHKTGLLELSPSLIQRKPERVSYYVHQFVRSQPQPLGVVAFNDVIGVFVTQVCREAGLAVPERVAVVGIANDPLVCNLSYPRLSSVAVNVERAGYEAAELLDRIMAGKEKGRDQKIFFRPAEVVVRESSDIFAVEDPGLAKALRHIQEHSDRPVRVDNVAQSRGPVASRPGAAVSRSFRPLSPKPHQACSHRPDRPIAYRNEHERHKNRIGPGL